MLGTVARRQTLEHGPSRVATQRRRGTANVLGPRSADKPLETLCNSRVEIVSEEPAPPISLFPVTVHYLESGVQKTVTIQTRCPAYFDGIAVSTVREVLPGVSRPQIALRSLRDVARLAYHTARGVEASISAPIVMQKPVFDTRHIYPNNWAHHLLDIIPYCLYARRATGREVSSLRQT